jgi:hypothetical protein
MYLGHLRNPALYTALDQGSTNLVIEDDGKLDIAQRVHFPQARHLPVDVFTMHPWES